MRNNLWFQNSEGKERLIAAVESMDEVYDCIQKFVDQCNEYRPDNKKFKIYYYRTWQEDGRTKIDVGSWSEFFYTDIPQERNDVNDSEGRSNPI